MKKVIVPVVMLVVILSFFLLKKEDRTPITENHFEILLKNHLVEHLIIIKNRKEAEVYLDTEAIAGSDAELGKNLGAVCVINLSDPDSFSSKLVKILERLDPEDRVSYEYGYRGRW